MDKALHGNNQLWRWRNKLLQDRQTKAAGTTVEPTDSVRKYGRAVNFVLKEGSNRIGKSLCAMQVKSVTGKTHGEYLQLSDC